VVVHVEDVAQLIAARDLAALLDALEIEVASVNGALGCRSSAGVMWWDESIRLGR
jgi:hypothetical protein